MRLTDVIADREARIATNAARVIELNALIAADEAELAALDPADDAARITLLTGAYCRPSELSVLDNAQCRAGSY